MKTQHVLFLLAALAVTVVGSAATAEMVWDPPWVEDATNPIWAGGVTTHQRWEFDEHPSLPVDAVNPFGQPWVEVGGDYGDIMVGPDGQTEIPTWRIGPDGGGMMIYVPNNPDPNQLKVIFIQLTSTSAPSGDPVSDPAGDVFYPKGPIKHGSTSWYTYTYQIEIPFNPPEEFITFQFPANTNISELVVDTICVPEPVTAMLLAFGGAALAGWRRRRRA